MSIPAGKVIFRSSVFPGLVMTDVMLKVFRGAYKNIKHFEPELRKMEAWLVTHPDRVPRSKWSAFINTWMRNANTYALQAKQGIRTDMPGSERGSHKSEPRSIMDLFKEMANVPTGGSKSED